MSHLKLEALSELPADVISEIITPTTSPSGPSSTPPPTRLGPFLHTLTGSGRGYLIEVTPLTAVSTTQVLDSCSSARAAQHLPIQTTYGTRTANAAVLSSALPTSTRVTKTRCKLGAKPLAFS